jgi:ArsR family transcriptional regulator, nickel/cobalt-responsive transcriptional repressor
MTAETAERVADAIQALGTPSRIRILSALAVAPRSVSELAAHIQMEQPAVSQQLRILRDLELVTGERKGRQVIYSLHDPHIADLLTQAIAHSEHLDPRPEAPTATTWPELPPAAHRRGDHDRRRPGASPRSA